MSVKRKNIAKRVPVIPALNTGQTVGHRTAVVHNLAEMAENIPAVSMGALEVWQDNMLTAPDELNDPTQRSQRQRFAELETARELAATVLAAGGTISEAAGRAGVTARTVSSYLTNEAFRHRVDEHRSVIRARVGGRIESWMERKTLDPAKLDESDPRAVLAIYDRIAPVGKNIHAEQTNVTINNYAEFMERLGGVGRQRPAQAQVVVDDPGTQGRGFPLVGPDGPPVASGGS